MQSCQLDLSERNAEFPDGFDTVPYDSLFITNAEDQGAAEQPANDEPDLPSPESSASSIDEGGPAGPAFATAFAQRRGRSKSREKAPLTWAPASHIPVEMIECDSDSNDPRDACTSDSSSSDESNSDSSS